MITNSVVVPLMNGIEAFMTRHKIHREGDMHEAHFVLWERFIGEFYTLAEEDPKKRVELFFSKINNDINDLVIDTACTQREAVTACIKKLHELNRFQARPTFALDPPFWVLLFSVIEAMYFNNLKVPWEENIFSLAAATAFGVVCYDNSNVLLYKWKEILEWNTRQTLKGLNVRQQIQKGVVNSGLYLR